MGNYRFRLSDMMPNAWFYKLRDMSKLKNQPIKKNLPSSTLNPRKSFYYTTDSIRKDINLCNSPKFLDTPFPYNPPTKSSNKKSKRKTIYMPSPRKITPSVNLQDRPNSSDDQDFLESMSEFDPYDDGRDQSTSPCSCELTSSASDIVIDVDETSYAFTEYKLVSELELPPIVTKPKKLESPKMKNSSSTSVNFPPEKMRKNRGGRKSVSRSGGVRIRRRKSVKSEKKGLFCTESFAVVKASFDPEKDFRDSMMEMIVENKMRESKDLEDLLACYLSLNENQYHQHIIKAFEQIWFDIPQIQV